MGAAYQGEVRLGRFESSNRPRRSPFPLGLCCRLDVTPMELTAILRWTSYKDFTPTEFF